MKHISFRTESEPPYKSWKVEGKVGGKCKGTDDSCRHSVARPNIKRSLFYIILQLPE